MLNSGWEGVAKKHQLKDNDIIQLWSFRINKKSYLALLSFRFLAYNFISVH